jgi:hypothetical protein
MSSYAKSAAEASDKYLASLADTQEALLSSISKYSAMAPASPAPAFVADLPTPREISDVNFTFMTKLLKQQKDFTDKFFTATAATEDKKSAPAKTASAKN